MVAKSKTTPPAGGKALPTVMLLAEVPKVVFRDQYGSEFFLEETKRGVFILRPIPKPVQPPANNEPTV